jgi:hypothetical protein
MPTEDTPMTVKPFTKIVDYTAEDLEDAILGAVEHCKKHDMDFYTILRGIDSYFEKRHRRLHSDQSRITSWQGDHSTGEWKTHGPHPKQKLSGQGAPYGRTTSGGSTQRPLQQGPDASEEDPGYTPSLGGQRPRGQASAAGPTDQEPGPRSANPAVPDGRGNDSGQRRPGPKRTS